jgi:RNA polymerase sigma-70 factor (ECF subfamily)
MTSSALARAAREAGGRIVAALAVRYRDIDIAEDAFAEACARAAELWDRTGEPADPAAWLYTTAQRCAIDTYRRRKRRNELLAEQIVPEPEEDDVQNLLIRDDRLRLMFVCCHPAIAQESRAALTLSLVCGLSTEEIAHAFLVSVPTLSQRLVRAKRKIAEAGISYEVPGRELWPERLEAVLSTIEIAYAKAHEDAAGVGEHANYAAECLRLTAVLADLLPDDAEVLSLAATVRYAEARRPARLAADGTMIPLSHQDPLKWRRGLIAEAEQYLARVIATGQRGARSFQAAIHGAWCSRASLDVPAPWAAVLALYDRLLQYRDDVVVRLNRIVALAEVRGVDAALAALADIYNANLEDFQPYHAVRAHLLREAGQLDGARVAYGRAAELTETPAERKWLDLQRSRLH